MSEIEKQENQKTVVAFITGLLIGGLLVWVFSSTPESKIEEMKEDTTDVTEITKKDVIEVKTDFTTAAEPVMNTNGSLAVLDQSAGPIVVIDKIQTPTKSGWVVIRDYMDGIPGNVLGAARYNIDEGLVPTKVELMRETISGSSYQIVFYTNEGDQSFALVEDRQIEGISATFKVQ